MQPKIEYRSFDAKDFHLEERDDGGTTITGYAAVFNSFSVPFFGLIEKIAEGAFERDLRDNKDVRALVEHDPSKLLGRTRSKTLTLNTDHKGLKIKLDPPDTTAGRDIVEQLKRGDIDQMSFGFHIRKETIEADAGPDGEDVRSFQPGGSWALAVGNEGVGVRVDIEASATHRLAIPMPGGTNSLNAGVAGSILLYSLLTTGSASN